MGWDANGTDIYITRGDTAVFNYELTNKDDDTPYEPEEGDEFIFAMKRSTMTLDRGEFTDDTPILTKTLTVNEGLLVLSFASTDTKNFPFGVYRYDIRLQKSSGHIDTFVQDSSLIIGKEEHFYGQH